MSIRKVVTGLLITAGIAIMAVPFFWGTTGERNTNQLINEFEKTLEEKQDERSEVEKEQTTVSKEEEAIRTSAHSPKQVPSSGLSDRNRDGQ